MPKTRTFRLVDSRLQFKCPLCKAKRMVTVPGTVRRRSIRCHKCKELTRCVLNRRVIQREQQYGKVMLTTSDGFEFEVDLFDISINGVGFELPYRSFGKVKIGREIQFRCSWNPGLLKGSRFIVKSINGSRVGAEQIKRYSF